MKYAIPLLALGLLVTALRIDVHLTEKARNQNVATVCPAFWAQSERLKQDNPKVYQSAIAVCPEA